MIQPRASLTDSDIAGFEALPTGPRVIPRLHQPKGSLTDSDIAGFEALPTGPRVIPRPHQPKGSLTNSDIAGFEALQDHRLSSLYETTIRKSPVLNSHQTISSTERRKTNSSSYRTRTRSPSSSTDDSICFSPKASLGRGAWDEGEFVNNRSVSSSTSTSRDEDDFQRDLANLDADIARIQRSLRETARRS